MDRQVKWNRFREARTEIADRYLALKRVQRQAEGVVLLIFVHEIIKQMKANFEEEEYLREVQLHSAFMCLKIFYLWRKRLTRHGGNIKAIMKKKVIVRSTFIGVLTHEYAL